MEKQEQDGQGRKQSFGGRDDKQHGHSFQNSLRCLGKGSLSCSHTGGRAGLVSRACISQRLESERSLGFLGGGGGGFQERNQKDWNKNLIKDQAEEKSPESKKDLGLESK